MDTDNKPSYAEVRSIECAEVKPQGKEVPAMKTDRDRVATTSVLLGAYPTPPAPGVFQKYRQLQRRAVELRDEASRRELKAFMADHHIGGEGVGVTLG